MPQAKKRLSSFVTSFITLFVTMVLLAVTVLPAGTYAHHSRSAFNLDETIEFDADVTEVGWKNPHLYLTLTERATGTGWTLEGHSIPGLVRNGWRRNSIVAGSHVRVAVNPNKDPDTKFALLIHVTREDGKTFHSFRPTAELLQKPKPPLSPSTDFGGTWRLIRTLRANLVGGFEPPKDWPLTSTAQAEVARFDLREDPSYQCEPPGVPRMLAWPYTQSWQVEDDGIAITLEHSVDERYFNKAGVAPARSTGNNLGTSTIVARSDSELVVETVGFPATKWGLTRGISSGPTKRLTERYELVDGGYKLRLTYTVEDADYLTAPVRKTLEYAKVHDFEFAEEPPCDIETATRHLEFER